MGVKYTIPFLANDGTECRVDIATALYSTGDPISLRGQSQKAVELAYDAETTDDPFSCLIPSTATINPINTMGIDIEELQLAQDKDFTVSIYRDGNLFWTGYLVPSGIQQPLKGLPYTFFFEAKCGLSMLDTPYVHADLPGLSFDSTRCIMNYIRQILFSNLGIMLPIKWSNSVVCSAFGFNDVFTDGPLWSVHNEGFYSYQSGQNGGDPGPSYSCEYLLKGFLQAFQCRIYQSNGQWVIRRVNDMVAGTLNSFTISGDVGIMSPTFNTENLLKQIGSTGYRFVLEDAVKTVKRAAKTCKVTYNANVRENILPNGSQDLFVSPTIPEPIYWGGYGSDEPLVVSQDTSLDGRDGKSTELSGTIGTTHFTMIQEGGSLYNDGLPIDTKVLIKRINFGFLFSPQNFPTTGTSDNIIDWSTSPLQLQMVLNLFGVRFYLNDYGYWQTDPATLTITVDGMRLNDIVQVNYDKFQGIPLPEPTDRPQSGDISDLQVIFLVKAGTVYRVDNISVTIDSGDDVYESTYTESRSTDVDERTLNISSSFSGYMLSNIMTDPFLSDDQCEYSDGIYTGTLTGLTANAIMRSLHKPSRIFNGSVFVANKTWTFDEIYLIETLGTSRFLPLNANYNMEKCITSIVAIETRNENPILVEKYYSSNDKTLSN